MAFDKIANPSVGRQSFRNTVNAREQQRPRGGGGGGGGKPYYLDAFKAAIDGTTDTVRIVPGSYEVEAGALDGKGGVELIKQTLQYYPWIEHYHGTKKRGMVCSAGPLHFTKDKREPCIGCDEFFNAFATLPKGQRGPMSKSEKNAFTILHYAPYVLTEQLDKDLKVRTDNNGKPYMEWVRLQRNMRNDPQYKDKEMRDAHVLHWSLGGDHWKVLTEYDRIVGDSCKSCGGLKTIKSVAWACPNCGEALIEPETTVLSNADVEKLTSGPVTCGACQKLGRLQEIIECGGCNKAARAEIFDVDLDVRRLPDKDGGNRTQLMIVGHSPPRPIDARFLDLAKPLDFAKIFTPLPLEKQMELFGGGGGSGRQPVTAAQQSRAYPTLNPQK